MYYANVSEDAVRGTTVRRVTATDLDSLVLNKEITYTSTGADAKFYINRATGWSIEFSSNVYNVGCDRTKKSVIKCVWQKKRNLVPLNLQPRPRSVLPLCPRMHAKAKTANLAKNVRGLAKIMRCCVQFWTYISNLLHDPSNNTFRQRSCMLPFVLKNEHYQDFSCIWRSPFLVRDRVNKKDQKLFQLWSVCKPIKYSFKCFL